ncbi:MAG: Gfo/Idh/MocA family oxidoreductase [Gemmatimonadaceae bacterium]
MIPQTVRVLFLGCGAATRMHSKLLVDKAGVELAYASSDGARAVAFAREFSGVRAWGSYEDALADGTSQVVLVATPTNTHAALTLMSLRARKHVIVEKPAFMSSAEADAVRETARLAQRQVFVAENYVYKPIALAIREAIRAGQLGDIRFVSINATRWQQADGWRANAELSGGGALFEAGVHWISFAARIGLDIVDIRGWRVGARTGTDRSSLVAIEYANGAMGTLAHSWELRGALRGARLSKVQGTRGSITFESNGFVSVTTGSRPRLQAHLRDPLGYRTMHAAFLHALRHGEEPYYTLDMATRDLRWLELAQRGVDAV